MSEYVVNVGEFVGVSGKTIQFPEYIDLSQEIVRCRDCKHFMRGNLCSLQDEWNEFHWFDVEPDGFCKWGERK